MGAISPLAVELPWLPLVAAAAASKGLPMLDAPVSGGVGGAQAGTLTFMVGGPDDAFARGRPILETMGKTIVHAGGAGNGQARHGNRRAKHQTKCLHGFLLKGRKR